MIELKPHQIKRLELIQANVARMAQHSFALKGWCVSLVLAFVAVILREGAVKAYYYAVALPVILCFWGLDAFYLRQEKLCRALYARVAKEAANPNAAFDMMLNTLSSDAPSWRAILFNRTIWPIYSSPLLLVLGVMFAPKYAPATISQPTGGERNLPAAAQQSNKLETLSSPSVESKSFEARFSQIMKTSTSAERYRFFYDMPKGGDLHNHINLSILANSWLREATKAEQNHGNRFYTRVRINNCKDSSEPSILYRNLQNSSYLRLTACQKTEYEPLATLSPAIRQAWLSSMKMDRLDEGRDEFFEALSFRLGDLGKDPYLVMELLIDNMKRFGSEGVHYLEVQVVGPNFQDKNGQPIDRDTAAQLLRQRLAQPDARATGVTVRFLAGVVRFLPTAEQELESAFSHVSRNRDLWVGVNLTGREDKVGGHALRFLSTLEKLRHIYSGINLSIHGGETTTPGPQVRQTLLLGAARVGHALNLIFDPETLLLMRNGKYLVETSLISNRLLGYVTDLSKHPFADYLRLGIPVCLNTDDRGAWDSNITDEYYSAFGAFNLSWNELIALGRNSLLFSFVESEQKATLLHFYEDSVRRFERKYSHGDYHESIALINPDLSGYATRNFPGVTIATH